MKEEINQYYNELAKDYDVNRFSNSYGKYIHHQENIILKKHLNQGKINCNLDLACGTGRFLKYADYGLDLSSKMVQISKTKFPDKKIAVGDAENLPFENVYFENVISFHLFMHLDLAVTEKILSETGRVTKKNGLFIFDVPSQKRRKITGYKSESWHGGNQISVEYLKKITKKDWSIEHYYGIAFFPIHRIPRKIRKFFIKVDTFFCNSFMKEYSSHLIFVLKKK